MLKKTVIVHHKQAKIHNHRKPHESWTKCKECHKSELIVEDSMKTGLDVKDTTQTKHIAKEMGQLHWTFCNEKAWASFFSLSFSASYKVHGLSKNSASGCCPTTVYALKSQNRISISQEINQNFTKGQVLHNNTS